jgi:hypothetical protein
MTAPEVHAFLALGGKTTLVECSRLFSRPSIRRDWRRKSAIGPRGGAPGQPCDSTEVTPADLGLHSPLPVVGSSADRDGFDACLTSLDVSQSPGQFVFLNEIGKVECISSRFRSLVVEFLESA